MPSRGAARFERRRAGFADARRDGLATGYVRGMSETERPERREGDYDPAEDPDTDAPATGPDDPLAAPDDEDEDDAEEDG